LHKEKNEAYIIFRPAWEHDLPNVLVGAVCIVGGGRPNRLDLMKTIEKKWQGWLAKTYCIERRGIIIRLDDDLLLKLLRLRRKLPSIRLAVPQTRVFRSERVVLACQRLIRRHQGADERV
jgi:hypothetical protein